MSSKDSATTGWTKLFTRALLRWVIYPAVFVLLYALSQGPAVYYHNRSIGAGRPGYAPFLTTFYAPMHKIQRWIPFYDEYMNWWLQPPAPSESRPAPIPTNRMHRTLANASRFKAGHHWRGVGALAHSTYVTLSKVQSK